MQTLTWAAIWVVSVASAEPPYVSTFWTDLALMDLLRYESVRKDLKLTPVQADKAIATAKAFSQKVDQLMHTAHSQFRPGIAPEVQAQVRARIAFEVNEEFLKDAAKVLTPDQIKRVQQIYLQSLGWTAFRSPSVIRQLKLTTAQQKAVTDTATRFSRSTDSLLRDAFIGGVTHKKITALTQALREAHQKELQAMVALLTPDQLKVWKQLVGDPFDTTKLTHAPRQAKD